METSKHHTNSKTKQKHEHRHIIQTYLTSPSDSQTLEKTLLPYITNNMAQKQPLYKHSSTQHKQHHCNRLQPKQTTRTHNHSSTRHEQTIPHTYTHSHINYTKQTSHTPLSNTLQTKSIATKNSPHSETKHQQTPIQKWCFKRRHSITHPLQYIHI